MSYMPPFRPNFKALLTDFDGCLYKFLQEHLWEINEAAAQAIIALYERTDLNAEDLKEEARGFYVAHGEWFTHCAKKYNLNLNTLHAEFKRRLGTENIEECLETLQALLDLNRAGVKVMIVSHGNRDWIKRALAAFEDRTGLPITDMFPDEHIVDLPEIGFRMKHDSADPVLYALGKINRLYNLNIQPHECVFLEDTLRNLFHPSSLGMMTLGVTHGYVKNLKVLADGFFAAQTAADQYKHQMGLMINNPAPGS